MEAAFLIGRKSYTVLSERQAGCRRMGNRPGDLET
jgi:hypothetical protein